MEHKPAATPATRAAEAATADPDTERLLRNGRWARRVHTGTYLTTAFLLLSGVALLGDGLPALADPLGGHVAAGRWHRWVGFGLVAAALLLVALRGRAAGGFLAQSVRFHRADLRWFAAYPRFVARPRQHRLPRHEGHFDPGQRALNLVVVLSFLVLSVTGIVLAYPRLFLPEAFTLSLRLHRLATWVLVGSVVGHLVVATGLLPGYRGVWRAMHRDGRVPARLARTLWPAWAERQEREASERTDV